MPKIINYGNKFYEMHKIKINSPIELHFFYFDALQNL